MTKAIFKKSLALLISVMLVLSAFTGALSVFAETTATEGDTTLNGGTYEDGLTTDGTYANIFAQRYDVPMNLDFDEGLKYWAGLQGAAGTASDWWALYEDATTGKNYAAPRADAGLYWQIYSAAFKGDGSTITFRVETKVNAKLAGMTNEEAFGGNLPAFIYIRTLDDAAQKTLETVRYTEPISRVGDGNSVYTYYTFETVADTYYCIGLETKVATATAFANCDGEVPYMIRIDEVELGADGFYSESDSDIKYYVDGQQVGGTEEEGVVITPGKHSFDGTTTKYAAHKGFRNGDFSEGFKYWTTIDVAPYDSIDDLYKLTDDGIEYYADGYKYSRIRTMPFTLDGVKSGDKLRIIANINNVPGTVIELSLYENTTKNAVSSGSEYTVTGDSSYFWIEFEDNKSAGAKGLVIEKIQLLKVNDDGTYTDLQTGDTVDANGGEPGGTYEDGLKTDGAYANIFAQRYDVPMNLDFDEGLKYWAGLQGAAGTASDWWALYEDATTGKNYAAPRADAGLYWQIYSAAFKGDGSTITFRVETKVNAKLAGMTNEEAFGGNLPAFIYIRTLDDAAQKTLETVRYTEPISRVGDGNSVYTYYTFETVADTYYCIGLETKVATATAFANCDGEVPYMIRIDEVELGADGFYSESDSDIKYYVDGQQVGGTAEYGVLDGYVGNKHVFAGYNDSTYTATTYYGATEGLMNGDFSDGFKYWTLRTGWGHTSDDGAFVINSMADLFSIEDGVLTYKGIEKAERGYYGFASTPFALKNSVNVGDKIYLAFDMQAHIANKVHFNSSAGDSVHLNNIASWNEFASFYTEAITITESNINATFAFNAETLANTGLTMYKNFCILKADKGGLDGAKVTLDGELDENDLYGDANCDGKVDLIDLVRMKK